MNQDGTMEMPIYDMPYRILRTVMHLQPKLSTTNVERGIDEAFAYKLSTFTPRKLIHSSFRLIQLQTAYSLSQIDLPMMGVFHSWLVSLCDSFVQSCSKQKAGTDDASHSSPVFSSLLIDDMLHGSIKFESQSSSGVLLVKKIVTQIVTCEVNMAEYLNNRSNSRIIVSNYVNGGKPLVEKLADLIARMQATGADVIKLDICVACITDFCLEWWGICVFETFQGKMKKRL
ncbi:hypothetical protein V6N12_022716 [Hibiscus sabdariffa]|uniref:Uncharacterized protein n=1 Tax=Hibiscus sabdariffa TaxID=183260 RepID=A0ABR2FVU9_9ROSI